ncbi:hypothetical protein H0A36_27105 [Endozoicomonas sp. SM1973]|uniref:Uncharacterized protein n=1 Tax=Spartinivicinus marinus TaxID=2994442 RepID=A0A853IGM3_9GAMM|nr:hypothetical protein [Spartinivicinus marinus]NYZ69688.1 hypothetical protein [Spartinivicinus marinus]
MVTVKNNLTSLVLGSALVFSSFVNADPTIPPEEQCKTLFANQTEAIGMVCANVNMAGQLSIEYTLNPDSTFIKEIHLHVSDTMEEIPQTGVGNPKVGHFEYQLEGLNTTQQLIPLSENVMCGPEPESFTFFVAAHAAVEYLDINGEVIDMPTAWADGERFTQRGNWATYFNFTVNCPGNNG